MMLKLKNILVGLFIVSPLIGLLMYFIELMERARSGYSNAWHAIAIVVIIYLVLALLFNQKFKRFLGVAE